MEQAYSDNPGVGIRYCRIQERIAPHSGRDYGYNWLGMLD